MIKLISLPNLALLTPFGMPLLLPHLKNSFFPSKEKDDARNMVSGGGEQMIRRRIQKRTES